MLKKWTSSTFAFLKSQLRNQEGKPQTRICKIYIGQKFCNQNI